MNFHFATDYKCSVFAENNKQAPNSFHIGLAMLVVVLHILTVLIIQSFETAKDTIHTEPSAVQINLLQAPITNNPANLIPPPKKHLNKPLLESNQKITLPNQDQTKTLAASATIKTAESNSPPFILKGGEKNPSSYNNSSLNNLNQLNQSSQITQASNTNLAGLPTSAEHRASAVNHHTGVTLNASHAETNPKPIYPPLARRLGEEGTVVLLILVGANGNALQTKIKQSSGSLLLDQSAEKTIQKWQFNPAKINGQPVDEWYELPYRFNLE
jgi:TonB family protein